MFGIFKRVAELERLLEELSMDVACIDMQVQRMEREATPAATKKKRGRPRKIVS